MLKSQHMALFPVAAPEQRSWQHTAQLLALSGQGVHRAVQPGTDDHLVSYAGCGSCSMTVHGQGNKSEASPAVDYDTQPCQTRKPNQRIWAAVQSILQLCL